MGPIVEDFNFNPNIDPESEEYQGINMDYNIKLVWSNPASNSPNESIYPLPIMSMTQQEITAIAMDATCQQQPNGLRAASCCDIEMRLSYCLISNDYDGLPCNVDHPDYHSGTFRAQGLGPPENWNPGYTITSGSGSFQ